MDLESTAAREACQLEADIRLLVDDPAFTLTRLRAQVLRHIVDAIVVGDYGEAARLLDEVRRTPDELGGAPEEASGAPEMSREQLRRLVRSVAR